MRRWIAAAVIVTFASGCLVAPPPPQDAAPPSAGYSGGYANGQDDYARGEEDGRAAARRTPEVGAFCLGVTVGIVLPLAIVAAASGGGSGGCGGGSGGNCNGGGEHETLTGGSLPTDASASYSAGYRSGYQQERDARQGRAALLGFFAGLAIFGLGTAVYLSDPNNRTRTTNAVSNPTGAVLLRF